MLTRASRFLPPLLWMGVIAWFSGALFGSDRTGSWLLPVLARLAPGAPPDLLHAVHAALRKLGHLTEYGILAGLWLRAFAGSPRAGARALLLSVLYAALDESHQALVPNRSPSPLDVAIDAAGALLAVGCLRPGSRLGPLALGLARWAALAVAATSLAAALLDWSLGLAAWDLLAATLAAAATAVAVRRLERAWRGPS